MQTCVVAGLDVSPRGDTRPNEVVCCIDHLRAPVLPAVTFRLDNTMAAIRCRVSGEISGLRLPILPNSGRGSLVCGLSQGVSRRLGTWSAGAPSGVWTPHSAVHAGRGQQLHGTASSYSPVRSTPLKPIEGLRSQARETSSRQSGSIDREQGVPRRAIHGCARRRSSWHSYGCAISRTWLSRADFMNGQATTAGAAERW